MNSDNIKQKLAGKFIVLDGPDGCGKSTQVKMLAEWSRQKGVEAACFRDPGDTAIGEKIREILLNPEHSAMSTRTELLLYMAARAQLWKEKISKALQQNNCVIMDRWLSSTCAYQGYAGGFGIDKVIALAEACLERAWPDLTVVLDIDIETSSTRLKDKPDRMEMKGGDYHEKVRRGFLTLAESRDDFVIINSAEDIKTVHGQITESIIQHFSQYVT